MGRGSVGALLAAVYLVSGLAAVWALGPGVFTVTGFTAPDPPVKNIFTLIFRPTVLRHGVIGRLPAFFRVQLPQYMTAMAMMHTCTALIVFTRLFVDVFGLLLSRTNLSLAAGPEQAHGRPQFRRWVLRLAMDLCRLHALLLSGEVLDMSVRVAETIISQLVLANLRELTRMPTWWELWGVVLRVLFT